MNIEHGKIAKIRQTSFIMDISGPLWNQKGNQIHLAVKKL